MIVDLLMFGATVICVCYLVMFFWNMADRYALIDDWEKGGGEDLGEDPGEPTEPTGGGDLDNLEKEMAAWLQGVGQ